MRCETQVAPSWCHCILHIQRLCNQTYSRSIMDPFYRCQVSKPELLYNVRTKAPHFKRIYNCMATSVGMRLAPIAVTMAGILPLPETQSPSHPIAIAMYHPSLCLMVAQVQNKVQQRKNSLGEVRQVAVTDLRAIT